QGTANVLVTFTLAAGATPVPPGGAPPSSVTLGTITGSLVTHDSQYIVTAQFAIPALEPVGWKDAAVVFTLPEGGTLTYSKTATFQVTAGSGVAASFTGTPTSGKAPLTVSFTDSSTGTITNHLWNFGDGATSTANNPSHTYTNTGSYTVSLAVFATAGSNTLTRTGYVTVSGTPTPGGYSIVDTGQTNCFDNINLITAPTTGQPFYGQDAQFSGTQPSYTKSSDGLTVKDNVTGLTWQMSPDTNGDGVIDSLDKMTLAQAQTHITALNAANYGGYNDWRLPTIKELYSLITFAGIDPSGVSGTDTSGLTPFIDRTYFDFGYGDTARGERIIDMQYASSTLYVYHTMLSSPAMFGVNFADGRIKGYSLDMSWSGTGDSKFPVRLVRGVVYGANDFVDNGDSTITDRATKLMWSKGDSAKGLNWQEALAWAQTQNAENYLGHSDWRLPNAKELQNIVDYTRSPDTTSSAAISPLFTCSGITNEAGNADFPFYWTSTTHMSQGGGPDASAIGGGYAVYVAFGRAMGYMTMPNDPTIGAWLDVHGAGAQRSDPKVGNPADYPQGHGPQGDAIRIYNYVRLVRDALRSPVVDTGQTSCYDNTNLITAPTTGQPFYGQDAQFSGTQPSYTKSGDGLTVKDNVTGLTWQQSHYTGQVYWEEAQAVATVMNATNYGGYSDWRLPTIKELYSLWNGNTGWPFIDTSYFTISYASEEDLSHAIFWSSSKYSGLLESTVDGNVGAEMAFGVNFGTGHIKAYSIASGPRHLVRCVRGASYGINSFLDHGDGTVTDQATGSIWARTDSGSGMDWEHALAYAQTQNAANYLGHRDWRLPSSKELQSLVDYTRSPGATDPANVGPAIDPLFDCTGITNEAGDADYPWYWTSTTNPGLPGATTYDTAWYVAFGRAVGPDGKDLHGAGAIRFDAKVIGAPGGESRYVNYVRLVRNAGTAPVASFSAAPTSGGAPLTVTFADTSTDTITTRSWNFGDGTSFTTTGTNVTHTYNAPGTNTVRLIVSGPSGSSTNLQANLVVATSVDSIGDGIPDWWRVQYFGGTSSTTNANSCAAADPDHDGVDNHHEYIADTNPTNGLSYFHIQSVSNATSFAVFYPSSASRKYTLYCRTNLTSGAWMNVPSQTDILGSGALDVLTDPSPNGTLRFHRIGVRVP
ncbi:MAG: DUF1566 domain-containing protein, partial [Verrucomicrobiota bacterium]